MPRKALSLAVIFMVQFLRLTAGPDLSPAEITAQYEKAMGFFNAAHPTEQTDAQALDLFGSIITELENTHSLEDILFQSYVKKGVLLDVKGYNDQALLSYSGALRCLRRHPDWSDSLYFRVYIYAGPDYYKLENFDSAYTMLTKAELLVEKYPDLSERDRLFNALGALFYESGNYLQGKNYFTRALEIIQKERPGDKISQINFENNLASCLYKLGDYQPSIDIYEHLIQFGQSSSQLYLNMGKSYIGLNKYPQALALFRRVNPAEVPGVFNEMAYVEFLLNRKDSALVYLDKWVHKVPKAQQNNIDAGNNNLYRAQVLIAKRLELQAIDYLQQAIITFSGTFTNTDFHVNPLNFTGSFASYRLYDALSYKALVLETLYSQNGKEEYILAALSAYNSAILLFRHIEKTYTTDDAKLFLKKNNRDLYQNAFLACIELDRLHPRGPYLEQAFLMAEKSKASILSGSLDEMAYEKMPGIDPSLLQKQREIKYNIARLELKTDPERGITAAPDIAGQKADYEIALSFIQKSMEQNSEYYKMKFEDSCPGVRELEGQLRSNQAIVSLFVSKLGLHVFIVTASSFHYLYIDSLPLLEDQVTKWLDILNNTERGYRFGNSPLENQLYRRLVAPLQTALKGKDEWTLIPDGIFYLLPFESLPSDKHNHLLIETTTISYEISSKFLAEPFRKTGAKFKSYSVLSVAPFAGQGQWVSNHPLQFMDRLPGSAQEIAGLPGKQFIDEQATKEHFLQQINHFPVIHLATHAEADPDNNQSSLICFYPKGKDPEENCLYLPELYALNMDSTDLVILSACESGKGEIVDNEGMISLSRGFMYAGCASTVNSLWKADDAATAAILHQFHVYLERGYSKSAALRLAKLDYIHSNALYTTPNYWANLILIGNTEAIVQKTGPPFLMHTILTLVIVSIIVGGLFIWRVRSTYPRRSYS